MPPAAGPRGLRAARPRLRPRRSALAGSGRPRALLLGRPLGVQRDQPREHLVTDLVGPAIAIRLLLVAPLLLVDLVVEQELALGRDVVPAVGGEDGAVHLGVQLAQPLDVRVGLVGIVEAVVGLRQALVVADHQRGAELVVRLAGGLERQGRRPSPRGTGRFRSSRRGCTGGRPSASS